MNGPLDDVTVHDNPAAHRYEAAVNGRMALITYTREENRITFLHTLVPPSLEGHGLAGRMARFALDDARSQHLEVIPRCPYVAAYIRRHSEYLDLVPTEGRIFLPSGTAEEQP